MRHRVRRNITDRLWRIVGQLGHVATGGPRDAVARPVSVEHLLIRGVGGLVGVGEGRFPIADLRRCLGGLELLT